MPVETELRSDFLVMVDAFAAPSTFFFDVGVIVDTWLPLAAFVMVDAFRAVFRLEDILLVKSPTCFSLAASRLPFCCSLLCVALTFFVSSSTSFSRRSSVSNVELFPSKRTGKAEDGVLLFGEKEGEEREGEAAGGDK